MRLLLTVLGSGLLSTLALASSNEGIRLLPKFPGSDKVFVYGFALHQAIDKFQMAVVHDVYNNRYAQLGVTCQFALDARNKITHCLAYPSDAYTSGNASAALISAFKQSLRVSNQLKNEMDGTIKILLFDPAGLTQEALNKHVACVVRSASKREARRYWRRLSDNFTNEFRQFEDPARRKTIRLYFEAVSRTYGMYAARMKKISRQIEVEYDCDGDGGS